ncbi:MAG: DUF1015 domain-containing protein [Saprospirales bacterium]|nr:DUF1015 domain-containing protein [Saprospirales bacterium]MBK8491247.1 DUF1015 domain-containing protein [Saprospirales bacterium]
MHLFPFKAIYPNLDLIASPDVFFGNVKVEYPSYRKHGFFRECQEESLYIYRIVDPTRNYTGIVTCVAIQDYLSGMIRKHENTLPPKEQQQTELLLARKAVVKPVLLTYPPVEAIYAFSEDLILSQKPFFEIFFDADNQLHQFWNVSDPGQILLLKALFEQYVPTAYIADGHHRTSTLAHMYEISKGQSNGSLYDRMLCAFFPSSELEILDYNRVIEGLEDISFTTFMAQLSQIMDIEVLTKPSRPREKHEMVMFINREWFRLRWRKRLMESFQGDEVLLDVQLLNELILENILGISDVRTDERVKYIEGRQGIKGVSERVDKNINRVGFFLYPVSMDDFMRIADEGQILPPKSTYFEPRMRNGVLVQGV